MRRLLARWFPRGIGPALVEGWQRRTGEMMATLELENGPMTEIQTKDALRDGVAKLLERMEGAHTEAMQEIGGYGDPERRTWHGGYAEACRDFLGDVRALLTAEPLPGVQSERERHSQRWAFVAGARWAAGRSDNGYGAAVDAAMREYPDPDQEPS